MTRPSNHSIPPTQAVFASTQWSLVVTAQAGDTQSSAALETLCRAYWKPLYAFVRRQGVNPDEAMDMTQGFFTRLLEKDWMAAADQERGRFRNYLMTSIKHFMSNEWAKQRAKKRGGGCRFIPIDAETAETQYRLDPVDTRSPERTYERQWALTVLEQVMDSLHQDYQERDKAAQFESLKPCLVLGSQQQPYAELAQKLETTEGAVRVMVHRLKQQYRHQLRHHIAQTVASADEVEQEMQHLFQALTES